jgi:hypothetical protein
MLCLRQCTLVDRTSEPRQHLPSAPPASRLLVKKRLDTFRHYTVSVFVPHIKEIYMTTSDVLVIVIGIWSEQNTFSFEIFMWAYNRFHVNFTCIFAMLLLLMQHEDGVTFTDAVWIGTFTTIRPFVSVTIAGNRHYLIYFSQPFFSFAATMILLWIFQIQTRLIYRIFRP